MPPRWPVALLCCIAASCRPVPVPLPECHGLDAPVRPLAIVADRVSDRLELLAFAPELTRLGCLSLDENSDFIDEPFDLALSGDTLYVVLGHAAGYQLGTLLALRLGDGARLGQITLGEEPSMLALSADGRRAYVTLFRNLSRPPAGPWSDAGALVIVDTESMKVLGQVDVCAAALGVALDETRQRAWVACAGADALALVDVSVATAPRLERTVSLVALGGSPDLQPAYVALDGSHAFVTAQGSGELWILDQATAALARRVTLGSGSFPQRLVLTHDRRLVLVAVDGNSELAAVSTSALIVVDRVPLPGVHPQGIALTADDRTALVTDEGDLRTPGRTIRVDLTTLGSGTAHADATAPVGVFPQAIAIWY